MYQEKERKNEKGITLIALIITIIVLLILAGVSLNAIVGENGIISNAQKSSIATKFAKYKEEVEFNLDNTIICAGEKIKDYIQSIEESDINKFIILNGKLSYVGNEENEKQIAKNVGIDIESNVAVDDITKLVDKFIPLADEINLPKNDTDPTPEELQGKRLYSQNIDNEKTWDIVIDYDNNNQVKGRYGSNFYLLEKGSYQINGEDIDLKCDYVINYQEKSLIGLSDRYVEWNINKTLAEGISENQIALNIDPQNFENYTSDNGNLDENKLKDKNIEIFGDVRFDENSRALLFNKSSDGGYLKLSKSGLDFSSGFSFEIYENLSRIRYDNGSGTDCLGLFCRIKDLSSPFANSLRFGLDNGTTVTKFCSSSKFTGSVENLRTGADGSVNLDCEKGKEPCFKKDTNEFFTFVYLPYDDNKTPEEKKELYTEKMIEEKLDKVTMYLNGEKIGSTYIDSESVDTYMPTWNVDDCP